MSGIELAEPGSYGLAPAGYRLPEATRLGEVRLQVSDLDRSIAYYERVIGLRLAERRAGGATLTAADGGRVLVELAERPGARARRRNQLGLYHFAILLPDRAALGRFVRHLAATGERAGAGDHLVSEAFYLNDPDGLGIEVYADRPRAEWRRRGRELEMATDPVDIAAVIEAGGDEPWTGMPAGTTIGHVHLHVGDLAEAARFYSDGIGFDRMVWSYPGALFLAAGGYHHHLGTNTWAGPRATPPAADDAQLLEWTIAVPEPGDVERVRESLAAAGYTASVEDGEMVARDPWGTAVRVTAAA